jgi:hypothetical protein
MNRMPRPLRLLVLVSVLVLAETACGSEPAPPPSARTPSATATDPSASATRTVAGSPSPTAPPTTSPDAARHIVLPARAPTVVEQDVAATDVDLAEMAPRGSAIGDTWRSSDARVDAIAFAWARADGASGFEVWARLPDAWRVVYAFTDEPPTAVFGVAFEDGDLTADGVPDALTFESTGGSGACGTWRVVRISGEAADEIWSRETCDTDVRIVAGDLGVRQAVYAPSDPHCCPSAYRTSTFHWTGERWTVVSRSTTPA